MPRFFEASVEIIILFLLFFETAIVAVYGLVFALQPGIVQ
jgi:hypothetical protein